MHDSHLTTLLDTARAVIDSGSLAPGDNFFTLGATSVDAVRLVSILETDHGLLLDMEHVFECHDFAELAGKVVPAA
ncbi:MAG: acyl carrier protein [Micromonosporaceae bacterium]